jgi:predicted NAD-dependent protein-ADP-ribosyltransferase YbiA (DUF1768 family)
MSQESQVITPFRPLDILNIKPSPLSYDQLHEFTGTVVEGTDLAKIIENQLEENQNMEREFVLDRLQNNGFLVRPCDDPNDLSKDSVETIPEPPKRSISQLIDSDDDDEYSEPSQIAPIGRKLNNTHIQLSDAVDKSLEKEKEDTVSEQSSVSLPKEPKYNDKVEEELNIDKNTVFILCSSKDEEKGPGKEPSEKIPKDRIPEFHALSKIPKWRQQLCNIFDAPFNLDENKWQNVEHFLIAAQYRNFSMEQAFAQYDNAVNIHKTKKHGNQKLAVDQDFVQREKQEMFHALYAKFTQNPELARILEATRDAQLFYRVNKQKKVEFTELMWLRQILREYVRSTLKPLAEEPLAPVLRKKAQQIAKTYDLSEVSIGQYATQLPQYTPDVIKASSYYMTNRTQFIQKINELYKKYGADAETSSSNFDLLSHQKVVRDYLDVVTPYRGLLVYHNLGTGKSCTSISVTEGMKNNKRVVIMVPASLRTNYEFELQKCGDYLYRNNQHWEFVSTDGRPELIPVLAKTLSMSPKEVEEKKGAYMVNVAKPPNYKNLHPDDQKDVREQIRHMINQKYTFLHYNANNLAKKVGEITKTTRNPFDHTTMVIDEAHNFISNIVGNLKKKDNTSIYVKLYDMLMDATDFKIVMLSGTPIINYPQEIAVMFNILRGYIYTWTFKIQVKTSEKVTTDYIRNILDKHNCVVYDFIEYTRNTLVVTRNPYGFVNVNNAPQKRYSQKAFKPPNRNTKKQQGGYGVYGVKLDERGNIDNEAFKKQVIHILKDYDLIVQGAPKVQKEKCLPDDEKTFQSLFLKETTNFADKNDTSSDIQHIQTLRRRLLGLTSYFRSANEKLLPEFVLNDEGSPFHEVKVPMSDYQMGDYAKIRKVELDKEKKQKTMKRMNNGELFQMASSYRVFSRTMCNFAFPTPPGRPVPKMKKDEEETEEDADGTKNEKSIENDHEYEKQIESAMGFLRENRDKVLSKKSLSQYSPKMLEILKNILSDKHKGLHLLYSNFVTMEGIGIFQEVLNANGFQEFKIKKENGRWVLDYTPDDRMCYALYTGKEDTEVREIMRNVFNGDWQNVDDGIALELRKIKENNMYGEIVKLFMITAAGAEGINLKNTRYVHIMEPYWHNVRLEQVVGRARRIKSHEGLPEDLRTVQVFLYLSVMSETHKKDPKYKEIQVNDLSKIKDNTPVTTDEYLYEVSQMKQKINSQFLRVIKETAMDCHLYIQEHKKHEPLICYGRGYAPDRKFVSYPALKMDLQEDTNKPEKQIMIVPPKKTNGPNNAPVPTKVMPDTPSPDDSIEDDSIEDDSPQNKSPNKEGARGDVVPPTQEEVIKSSEDLTNNKGEKMNNTSPSFISTVPSLAKTMYDETIEFAFYSKSNDKPSPGYGTGEKIPASKKENYKKLHEIKEWRKMLSNFWIEPFELHGLRWNSVEHYYQASKFRKENEDFYKQFSLDSNTELSKDPNMAKSAGGKTGKHKGNQIRPKTVKADSDFFNSNRINEEMYVAQYAKFTNPDATKTRENGETYMYLANMLLETKDAKLMHILSRSSEKIFFENLVVIRDLMKQNKVIITL